MNHSITVGDLVRALGALAGTALIAIAVWIGAAFRDSDPKSRNPNADMVGCFGWACLALGVSIILMLPGCTTPAVQTKIVTVNVPVAIHPVKPSDIPALPPPLGRRPPTVQQDADLALAGHCRDVAWITRAYPLLLSAAGLPPGQAPTYPECRKH